MKIPVLVTVAVASILAEPVKAETSQIEGTGSGYVSVRRQYTKTPKCLIDLGGFLTTGCLPSRKIDKDASVPVKTCSLSLDGDDGFLSVTTQSGPFDSAPGIYILRNLATHSAIAPYTSEVTEHFSTWDTGLNQSSGWEASSLKIVTASQISKVTVEFTPEGRIKTIKATRQTAPMIVGKIAGKWLDQLKCDF